MDLIGKKFERLLVIEKVGSKPVGVKRKSSATYWKCLCECGNTTEVRTALLNNGSTKSCGCYQKDAVTKAGTKHNMCKTRIYKIWITLVSRCTNPKRKEYEKYSRLVHDRCWFESFDNFFEDVGESYFGGATIDRIDNSKGYSKENCRWVTPALQARNKKKFSSNSSGYTGVNWYCTPYGTTYATAYWREANSKRKSKSFSVNKYGLLEAFALACAYRKEQIDRLNSLGYGYTETHGL